VGEQTSKRVSEQV